MCKRGLTADARRINYRGNDEGTSVILVPTTSAPPSRLVITVIIYSDSIVVIELSRGGASHSYRIIINNPGCRIEVEPTLISPISRVKIANYLLEKRALKQSHIHPYVLIRISFTLESLAKAGDSRCLASIEVLRKFPLSIDRRGTQYRGDASASQGAGRKRAHSMSVG